MVMVTNLHRTGLDFELLRPAGEPRKFARLEAGEARDLNINPKDPMVEGHRRAGLIRIGTGELAMEKRQTLPPPPEALISRAAQRRRRTKGRSHG